MRCSSGEVRAELPCGGRALVGPLARYQGTGIAGTADPASPAKPPCAGHRHCHTRTHTPHAVVPIPRAYRTPINGLNWGLSRAVILHIAGSVGSRLQPYRSGVRWPVWVLRVLSLAAMASLLCDHHPNSAATMRRVLVCCADFIASISIFLQLRLCAGLRHLSHGENAEALHTPRKHGPERRSGAAPAGPSPPDDC